MTVASNVKYFPVAKDDGLSRELALGRGYAVVHRTVRQDEIILQTASWCYRCCDRRSQFLTAFSISHRSRESRSAGSPKRAVVARLRMLMRGC